MIIQKDTNSRTEEKANKTMTEIVGSEKKKLFLLAEDGIGDSVASHGLGGVSTRLGYHDVVQSNHTVPFFWRYTSVDHPD